jgi:hypothetical protein
MEAGTKGSRPKALFPLVDVCRVGGFTTNSKPIVKIGLKLVYLYLIYHGVHQIFVMSIDIKNTTQLRHCLRLPLDFAYPYLPDTININLIKDSHNA